MRYRGDMQMSLGGTDHTLVGVILGFGRSGGLRSMKRYESRPICSKSPCCKRRGSLQHIVVDPSPGDGFFISKDILAVLLQEPGMQGRNRWVIQNARDLHRVRTERHFRSDDRNGRSRQGPAILS